MDTICLIDEKECDFSSCFDFPSYVESFHNDEMDNEFKVFNNDLYDEDFDFDQPITFHNIYKGTLHGVINPLFEEDTKVQDLVELGFNVDILSLLLMLLCYVNLSFRY